VPDRGGRDQPLLRRLAPVVIHFFEVGIDDVFAGLAAITLCAAARSCTVTATGGASGQATIIRRGFRQAIEVVIPLRDVQAVKVEVRDGLSPRRRLSLRLQGRRDLLLTRVGEPMPLAQLELEGAQLARFLGVPLDGV